MSDNHEIQKIDDLSTFLDLIALILSIEFSHLEKLNNTFFRKQSNKIIITALFLATCSSFINLSTAKISYDDLLSSKEKVSEKTLRAAKDLLTSRLFSVLASIYLIRATLNSNDDITE